MTKNETFTLTAELTGYISSENPIFDYSAKDIKQIKKGFSTEELEEYRAKGWLSDDFELFAVIYNFLKTLGVLQSADERYVTEVFKNAIKLGTAEFYNDPYIKNVKFQDVKKGNFLLTTASYGRGELFLYDAPDLYADIVVPKIAFFNGKVRFPTIYEGAMPWMSVCPSEINSMRGQMESAFGNVLVLGMGLGYYQYVVSGKPNVKSVTVVEISSEIIEIFNDNILPHFPCSDKIKIINADAIKFMDSVKPGEYDFIFADIWEGIVDGAPLYEAIKKHEQRLCGTQFTYWIDDQIRFYLEGE